MTDDAREAAARHPALDGLRGGLMPLGIAFHAALPYATTNGLLAGARWPPGLEWLATLAIATPILLAVHHVGLRGPAMSAVLGGRPRQAGADAARR